MERHFLLPITIAAALHAGLLLGIPRHPAEIAAAVSKLRPPKMAEPPRMEITPPPPDPDTASASAPAGKVSEVPITLAEHPEVRPTSTFTFEKVQADPAAKVVV